MRFLPLLAAGVALLAPAPASAWGKTGHRIVATIADGYLSGRARAGIRLILGDESLAEASTWPDEMRSDPDPWWQKVAGPFHYVTLADGGPYSDGHAPQEGDAVTALRDFAAIVRDPAAPPERRQLALRFIVHIVADLHQPLHAGNGRDKGGNAVKVRFMGEETNLHTVWDSGLMDQEQLSFTEYSRWLERRIAPDQLVAWWEAAPATWIAESVALHPKVYAGGSELSYRYVFESKPIVERRLQQGGVRLAAYLESLFGHGR
ncbi:MAG TPA: S1/P1 nuclease [Allosphingosinicella sp.]